MDGIDKITSRISADMDRELEDIRAKAAAEAAEIAAQYSQQAEKESESILARGRAAAAEREERLASVAQLEARKLILAAKQEVLEETFRRALDELLELPEKDYVELLGDKGRLTLSVETRPIGGGFVLSDGEVEVNGTFETLVRLQRRELDAAVAKVLFDEGV